MTDNCKTMHSVAKKTYLLRIILASTRGAIDLASVLVGIIVIGTIGGIIAAAVFIVIPWAQDNAAKANLQAVHIAEAAQFGFSSSETTSSYLDFASLVAKGLINTSTTITIGLNKTATCYVGVSISATGHRFFITDTNSAPKKLEPSTTFECPLVGGKSSVLLIAPVEMGSSTDFSALSATTVTSDGATNLARGLGVSPGSAVTGFGPGVMAGTFHSADAVAEQGQKDIAAAYADIKSREPTGIIAGDLNGRTILSGVYSSASVLTLTGTLTLDAQGDPDAIFIFQMATALNTGAGSNIILLNGAQPSNIYWQVGSSATFGAASYFVGSVLVHTSVTTGAGVVVTGQLLALNGAITLSTTTITNNSPLPASSPANMGTAANYSVLSATTVTSDGNSSLIKNLGVYPGTEITGFGPGVVYGETNLGNPAAKQAQADLLFAYNDVAWRAPTGAIEGDLAGKTILPGVHKSMGALSLSETVTFDAQGNPDAVFVIQVTSALTTEAGSNVVLTNGAKASNIYWQAGSSATLGPAGHFEGTVLAYTSISVGDDTTVTGRMLARGGAVTIVNNAFTNP